MWKFETKMKVFFTIGAKQENNFMIVKVLDSGKTKGSEQVVSVIGARR